MDSRRCGAFDQTFFEKNSYLFIYFICLHSVAYDPEG